MTFNPGDEKIPSNEALACKLWELMRRNKKFQEDVEHLRRLDAELISARNTSSDKYPAILEENLGFVDGIAKTNEFAGCALRWLVPDPLINATEYKHTKTGGIESEKNATIRPEKLSGARKNWGWKSKRMSMGGQVLVRGPIVLHFFSNRKAFRDPQVFIDEWKGWKPGQSLFSYETPWPETLEGFKSSFARMWRFYDSRPSNPITGNRYDSPYPHEIKLDGHEFHSKNYRYFAIPEYTLTKGEATAMGKWLTKMLIDHPSQNLALLGGRLISERTVMGTSDDWESYLDTETSSDESQTTITAKDFSDYRQFEDQITSLERAIDKWIFAKIHSGRNLTEAERLKKLPSKNVVIKKLNKIIDGECIYSRNRFELSNLRKYLQGQYLGAPDPRLVKQINLMLLEDTYPSALRKKRGLESPGTKTSRYFYQKKHISNLVKSCYPEFKLPIILSRLSG
ncbi:hypothetical protein N8566_01655 [Verrucomicrobia bacterium]|nr:hypothetical protein [Verrucomicrobiota bacterium]